MQRKLATDSQTADLFPEELERCSAEQVKQKLLKPLRHAIWSHHKARLIELYLKYFVYVTKHGTYIDGFAGPQQVKNSDSWSAKRVIESRPRFLRNFYLCELDAKKVRRLEDLWASQPPREKGESKRHCEVLAGDFNVNVDKVLATGVVTNTEATFALLDQRTFECHWSTVQKLSAHKKNGSKIELFYFLAVGWLPRSMAGIKKNFEKVHQWWGDGDGWVSFRKLKKLAMAKVFCERMKQELGYSYATPFPIRAKDRGQGRIMYYMIHATDHEEAPALMLRAYNRAIDPIKEPEQGNIAFSEMEQPHCGP